jgi:hypothetical protein
VIAEKVGIGYAQHGKYMWKVPTDLIEKLKNAKKYNQFMKGWIKVTGENGSTAKDNFRLDWNVAH